MSFTPFVNKSKNFAVVVEIDDKTVKLQGRTDTLTVSREELKAAEVGRIVNLTKNEKTDTWVLKLEGKPKVVSKGNPIFTEEQRKAFLESVR